MTQKERSRNAFIRDAKKTFNLSSRQATRLYSSFRSKYGGLIRATDLKRHPIVARRLAATEIQPRKDLKNARGVNKPGKGDGGFGGSKPAGSKRSVRTIEDWYDMYDFYDYDPVEYESSADYGDV